MFILRSPFESVYPVRNLHRVVIPRLASNQRRNHPLIQNRTDHCGGIQNLMWEVQQGGSLRQRAVDNGARSPLVFNESKKCTHTDINRYTYLCRRFSCRRL